MDRSIVVRFFLVCLIASVWSSVQHATLHVAHAQTFSVSVLDNSYSPEPFTIAPGTTIVWTNRGHVAHTVTSDDPTVEAFDSNVLEPGQSFSHTFTKVGAFTYHCSFHDDMLGTIVVQQTGSESTQPRATPAPRTVPRAIIQVLTRSGGAVRFTPKVLHISVETVVGWKNVSNVAQVLVSRTRGWSFRRTVRAHGTATHLFATLGTFSYTSIKYPKVTGKIVVHA